MYVCKNSPTSKLGVWGMLLGSTLKIFYLFSNEPQPTNFYQQSNKWIQKAMDQLHEKLPITIIVQVLGQASKVCVVKRDFNKAKYLMYQALSRAHLYYGSGNPKLAALLLDFGFYLLNSDQIEQSVVVYWVRNFQIFLADRKTEHNLFYLIMKPLQLATSTVERMKKLVTVILQSHFFKLCFSLDGKVVE